MVTALLGRAPRRGGLSLGLVVSLRLGLGCAGQDPGPAGLDSGSGSGTSAGEGTDTQAVPQPCAPISVPTLDTPGAQLLERVATREQIPGLAGQPTAHGQILGTLFAFDGRLHLGYGDYSDNTGPITMSAWDPSESAFVELGELPTEEVLWFRPSADALYSPAVDPDAHQGEGGVYRLDCGAPAWHVGTAIEGAVHVYDVAVQGEVLYAGTGSLSGQPARLMASTDRGESWTEVLRHESPADRFSRVYFLGTTDEMLLVSGQEHPAPDVPLAWVRRGSGDFVPLLDVPDLLLVPIVLGNAMVVAGYVGNPGRGTYQGSYRLEGERLVPDEPWPMLDGEPAQLVAWAPQPADDAHDERLLVLLRGADGGSVVARTEDLDAGPGGWQMLAVLPPLPDGDQHVSMALLLGDLYLGTRQGALDVLRQLEAPAG